MILIAPLGLHGRRSYIVKTQKNILGEVRRPTSQGNVVARRCNSTAYPLHIRWHLKEIRRIKMASSSGTILLSIKVNRLRGKDVAFNHSQFFSFPPLASV